MRNCCSAWDLLERLSSRRPILTFIRTLDVQLEGGIPLNGGIAEVCGLPGSGKTQMCLQLCCNVQIPRAFGGVQRKALFIDTEGSFISSRFEEIAKGVLGHLTVLREKLRSRKRSQSATASKKKEENLSFHCDGDGGVVMLPSLSDFLFGIHVIRCCEMEELSTTLHFIEQSVCDSSPLEKKENSEKQFGIKTHFLNRPNFPGFPTSLDNVALSQIGLIIVDSLTFPLRHFYDKPQFIERACRGLQLASTLNRIGKELNAAIVVTNQLTTKFSGPSRGVEGAISSASCSWLSPCLGESWQLVPSLRLLIDWNEQSSFDTIGDGGGGDGGGGGGGTFCSVDFQKQSVRTIRILRSSLQYAATTNTALPSPSSSSRIPFRIGEGGVRDVDDFVEK